MNPNPLLRMLPDNLLDHLRKPLRDRGDYPEASGAMGLDSCAVEEPAGGSNRTRYFRKFWSQYASPGTTAASVCSATRAIPVVVQACFPKKSTNTPSPGIVFWSARIPIVPVSFNTFSIIRAASFL